MKVLITGGSGFIGGHCADRLIAGGHAVTVFSRRRLPQPRADVQYFLGDVRDLTSVYEAVSTHDGVIHLAAVLGTQETVVEPLPAIDTNVHGSLNVFKAVRHYKKPCVFIAVGNHWMNNSYSISKTMAERFAMMFNREFGTRIAVVRGLNAYGPRQKVAPVRKIMPNLVVPALLGRKLLIYGDGSQVMDMIYVQDVCEVLVRALMYDHGLYDRVFEAGSGRRETVLTIAREVLKVAGGGQVEHVPMRPGEPEGSVVLGDPGTLRPLFPEGFEPLALVEGVRRTVEYYRGALDRGELGDPELAALPLPLHQHV